MVCRQLHYAPVALNAFTTSTGYGYDIIPDVTFSQIICAGNEKRILDCYHGPLGYYEGPLYDNVAAGVRCQGKEDIWNYSYITCDTFHCNSIMPSMPRWNHSISKWELKL